MVSTPDFERLVRMSGAWDRRHTDPSKNYGLRGMDLRFVLRGPLGAVQFVIFTNWQLPHVSEEWRKRTWTGYDLCMFEPMAADLGYHALAPRYEGQSSMGCDYVQGGVCYYDGSGLNAMEWMPKFLAGGTDWLWPELEKYYAQVFLRGTDS